VLRAFEYHGVDRVVLPAAFLVAAAGPGIGLAVTAVVLPAALLSLRTLFYRYELGAAGARRPDPETAGHRP
jgi:hypothetical protein